jgi:hypothetical protein
LCAQRGILGTVAEHNLIEAFGPDYLAGLRAMPMTQLRAKRDACVELETELSYLRRLAQARIDLIMAESERRQLGQPGSDATLIERLPQILGDHERGDSGRLPALFAPSADVQLSLGARLEGVLPSDQLGRLAQMEGTELDEFLDRLTTLERDVSAERRALHDIQDHIQEELVRRYRSGEATVDALLH